MAEQAYAPGLDPGYWGFESLLGYRKKLKVKSRSPWFNLLGYLACTVVYADGSKKTVLQHREVMEEHLGRPLARWEIVHHKDGDKRNNTPSNLEVMRQGDHARHHAKPIEWAHLTCVWCSCEFEREARNERRRQKKGMAGPFCGKSCAGKYHRDKQLKAGRANLRNYEN